MTVSSPINAVTVRMYRGILGDCFLLRIRQDDAERVVLIDCGVLQNVEDGLTMLGKLPPDVIKAVGRAKLEAVEAGKLRIRAIADDIFSTLKGPDGKARIDVLVVTHEHYDHISGFALARDIWESPDLVVGKLWMAWTENERDEDAISLRAHLGSAKNAVVRAAMAAEVLGAAGQSDELDALLSLSNFLGPMVVDGMALDADPAPELAVDAPSRADALTRLQANALALDGGPQSPKRLTTAETMIMLKNKAGIDNIRYCEPGEVIPPSDEFPLKTYVLGPPRSVERIKKDSPSAGARSEVYMTENSQILAVEATARRMLQRADEQLGASSATGNAVVTAVRPFAAPHSRPYVYGQYEGSAENKETAARAEVRRRYENDDRLRIDAEWLAGAEALALKLDSDTNNTSLVLAFELPDANGSVLLFPGDAQVGNWLSWGDQRYPASVPSADPASIVQQETIEDILKRVVFYKVGHHSSHNATAKERGLELMTSGNLVAANPLVEAVAKVQGPGKKAVGRGWKMPYDHLYERLKDATDSRIVQGDGDPTIERQAFEMREDSPKLAYSPDNLWVELTFKC